MNSRERFRETMSYGKPDQVPFFEEGIREEVLAAWREQGLPVESDLAEIFPSDRREEIRPVTEPLPEPEKWPTTIPGLEVLRQGLDPADPSRLPEDWPDQVRLLKDSDQVVMLRVHKGFFQTLGVEDWTRFSEVMFSLTDKPDFVRQSMAIQGDFTARLTEKILREVKVDALILSEPIGGNHGSLISPRMYEDFVLSSYQPVLDVVKDYGVETVILRTYANARVLIPSMLKWGFNCLWACEVDIMAMDYLDLRREFGKDLRLIGGFDLDILREDEETIRGELERVVPPLVADGGYVPLADGRVRADVPLEKYRFYRQLLQTYLQAG